MASLRPTNLIYGSLSGPSFSYLNAAEYDETYTFLATATVMVGATTITSDSKLFTFFIPTYVTYQTSPN